MNLNATILGQAIAFVLFVLFCMKYIWQPLMSVIERRQKEIADSLAATEQAKKDLDIAQANAIEQLKKAKSEARVIIEQANKSRVQILAEAKTKAEQERTKTLARAKIEINAERERAYEELRKQVATLAVVGAEKIIEHSVNIDVNDHIVNRLVDELLS